MKAALTAALLMIALPANAELSGIECSRMLLDAERSHALINKALLDQDRSMGKYLWEPAPDDLKVANKHLSDVRRQLERDLSEYRAMLQAACKERL